MSDPEYNVQHSANPVGSLRFFSRVTDILSNSQDQTELDEAFARNLLIQEQEEANRRRQRPQQAPQEPVPYQQRAHAPGQNAPGTNPGFQEATETFNRLAESTSPGRSIS